MKGEQHPGFKEVPVLHPTWEEFSGDFGEYIDKISKEGCEYGLIKVVPPPEWNARKPEEWASFIPYIDINISTPIKQLISNGSVPGTYQTLNMVANPLSVKKFSKKAKKEEPLMFDSEKDEEVEKRFWQSLRWNPPIYGADLQGSLFQANVIHWNLNRLKNVLSFLEGKVPGVTSSYLYFGMWKAMFAWHTEDVDLPSINYLHFGAPKRWYGIPLRHREKFESLARDAFPDQYKECPEFLRHKQTLISPTLALNAGIEVSTAVQRPGEFMITFPGCYHQGFNHGFNCAEATNFANPLWFETGKKAAWCKCRHDSVRIDVERLEERFKAALNGTLAQWDLEHPPIHSIIPATQGRMMAMVEEGAGRMMNQLSQSKGENKKIKTKKVEQGDDEKRDKIYSPPSSPVSSPLSSPERTPLSPEWAEGDDPVYGKTSKKRTKSPSKKLRNGGTQSNPKMVKRPKTAVPARKSGLLSMWEDDDNTDFTGMLEFGKAVAKLEQQSNDAIRSLPVTASWRPPSSNILMEVATVVYDEDAGDYDLGVPGLGNTQLNQAPKAKLPTEKGDRLVITRTIVPPSSSMPNGTIEGIPAIPSGSTSNNALNTSNLAPNESLDQSDKLSGTALNESTENPKKPSILNVSRKPTPIRKPTPVSKPKPN